MSTVKLLSSSGGSVEIAAPVTASNYVLTTPAVTSTVDTLARTGNVLQVVQGTTTTPASTSSSTFSDTGLTATITPTSASSKILIVVHQNGYHKTVTDPSTGIGLRLLRDTNTISVLGVTAGYTMTGLRQTGGSISTSYLDSPSTLSSVTYKTQINSANNTSSANVQVGGEMSTITLMEIAG